ncbi:MAG: hypothetical protein NT033_07035 [Candidatus Omnitrophica bacterium]|nr:hypothetical protein [Candidatus Omnitrophota bacterium]
MPKFKILLFSFILLVLGFTFSYATPTTLIWTPSTDIQPYGKVHLNLDTYTPVKGKDHNDNRLYVQSFR